MRSALQVIRAQDDVRGLEDTARAKLPGNGRVCFYFVGTNRAPGLYRVRQGTGHQDFPDTENTVRKSRQGPDGPSGAGADAILQPTPRGSEEPQP